MFCQWAVFPDSNRVNYLIRTSTTATWKNDSASSISRNAVSLPFSNKIFQITQNCYFCIRSDLRINLRAIIKTFLKPRWVFIPSISCLIFIACLSKNKSESRSLEKKSEPPQPGAWTLILAVDVTLLLPETWVDGVRISNGRVSYCVSKDS